MTQASRNLWILLLLLWCAAAAVGTWNLHLIDSAVNVAELQAAVNANSELIEADGERIRHLARRMEALVRPIESPAFGLLYLEQDLATLARNAGLSDFKMNGATTPSDSATVDATFTGGMSGAVQWLEAVQTQMPYLVVKGFQVRANAESTSASFTVNLLFRYRVSSPQA